MAIAAVIAMGIVGTLYLRPRLRMVTEIQVEMVVVATDESLSFALSQ